MGRVTADSNGDFYEAAQTEQEFIDEITVDQGKVHIVTAPTVRPGSQMFAALIEFHWYPPSEPALNDQFEVRGRIWEDIPYNVISFPRGRYPDAQTIAVQLGLRIADGVPTMLSSDPRDPILMRVDNNKILHGKHFPGGVLPDGQDNPRMFTLETNRRKKIETKLSKEEIYRRETLLTDKFAEGVLLRPREACQFIFGIGQFADEQRVRFLLQMSHDELMRLQGRR